MRFITSKITLALLPLVSALNAGAAVTPSSLDVRFVVDPQSPESSRYQEDFNREVRPQLARFMEAWEAAGASLSARHLRYYVQPTSDAPTELIMRSYFGADWAPALRRARAQIQRSRNPQELKAALDQHTCRFPLVFDRWRKSLDEELAAPHPDSDSIDRIRNRSAGGAEEALSGAEGIVDEVFKFPRSANADFNDTGALACDYIRMTSVIDPDSGHDDRYATPIFMVPGVVMHETGHALHFAIWDESGPMTARMHTPLINEAFGDAFTTAFLDDPCYARERDGHCSRVMDRYDGPVADRLFDIHDPHTDNQALRNLLWLAHQSNPTEFPRAFVEAIRAVGPALRARANELNTNDAFLEQKNQIERNYGIVRSFVNGFCARLPQAAPCVDQARYLGQLDADYLSDLATNAPTRIGQDRAVSYRGQPAQVHFRIAADQYENENLHLYLTQGGRTRDFQTYGVSIDNDDGAAPSAGYISFSEVGPGLSPARVKWTVTGELKD